MKLFGTKGQTALEYLLIVVVAIIVVVAVMVWMQSTTQTTVEGANQTVTSVLCGTHQTPADCAAAPNCAWNAVTEVCERA
jgi:uncharacterized protein (UPF0333 family)